MDPHRVRRSLGSMALALSSAAFAAAVSPPAMPLAPSTRHSPDEFGTQDYTVTVIPAASFTSDDAFVTDYGSLSRTFADNSVHRHYFAGVSIPSGAVIDFVGLECSSPLGGVLTVTPFYVDEFSGTTSGIVALTNTGHSFDSDYNASALGWQLVQNMHNAIVLDVDQAPGYNPAFGWVEIWWKRTVSPGPATATFTDVPTDSPYYKFVEALVAAGITAGYGDGRFGVNDPITRGQMAVFLSAALGLHWPY